jgi:hypothetical protein
MIQLDHDELDLAVFNGSGGKSIPCHFFNDRPIGEKILLCLLLRWKSGLQNAAVPGIPIRNLKRHRLSALPDLLFRGSGMFRHTLFL